MREGYPIPKVRAKISFLKMKMWSVKIGSSISFASNFFHQSKFNDGQLLTPNFGPPHCILIIELLNVLLAGCNVLGLYHDNSNFKLSFPLLNALLWSVSTLCIQGDFFDCYLKMKISLLIL